MFSFFWFSRYKIVRSIRPKSTRSCLKMKRSCHFCPGWEKKQRNKIKHSVNVYTVQHPQITPNSWTCLDWAQKMRSNITASRSKRSKVWLSCSNHKVPVSSCMVIIQTRSSWLIATIYFNLQHAAGCVLSRPMQRKLVTLLHCQLVEGDGRLRAIKNARSIGERALSELLIKHQDPYTLSANLWAAVRSRGCQFLGPAMQEEILK